MVTSSPQTTAEWARTLPPGGQLVLSCPISAIRFVATAPNATSSETCARRIQIGWSMNPTSQSILTRARRSIQPPRPQGASSATTDRGLRGDLSPG